tara:strand:- start:269 stop:853 length:585 start_codon:yes stop_codon:yes gene_type:complete
MAAGYVHNIEVDRYVDFSQEFDIVGSTGSMLDLTGYTARSQIRKHKDSLTAVSFVIAFPDRANGKMKMRIPAYTTSLLEPGRYYYDVLLTKPNGELEVVFEGNVKVTAGITTSCGAIGALGDESRRLCISIIDEADGTAVSNNYTNWETFRNNFPDRPFYLLVPSGDAPETATANHLTTLGIPANFAEVTSLTV